MRGFSFTPTISPSLRQLNTSIQLSSLTYTVYENTNPSETFCGMHMKKNMRIWRKNVMGYEHILKQVCMTCDKLKCLSFLLCYLQFFS